MRGGEKQNLVNFTVKKNEMHYTFGFKYIFISLNFCDDVMLIVVFECLCDSIINMKH